MRTRTSILISGGISSRRDLLFERGSDRAALRGEVGDVDAHEEERGKHLPPDVAQLAHVLLDRIATRSLLDSRRACSSAGAGRGLGLCERRRRRRRWRWRWR